jgi:hypothetical protein
MIICGLQKKGNFISLNNIDRMIIVMWTFCDFSHM